MDQLELIRSQLGGVVEKYRIYFWKRGFQENASFFITSEALIEQVVLLVDVWMIWNLL
ncbi:hypothetical protein QJ133_13360 [Priestia megaterium]|uniref:hypothetical protein n=1 Tax=Priestia megaterium TaxID=1404 RepID=UPI00249AC640|nr:hypothetical protein [Priestia megaterium]MDI3092110.1 hypothetical protein [Priestia megaterium]